MNKFNEGLQLEGLERTSILIEILSSRLGNAWTEDNIIETEDLHPSIYDDKAKVLLATASEALMELYQHIGRWGFEDTVTGISVIDKFVMSQQRLGQEFEKVIFDNIQDLYLK